MSQSQFVYLLEEPIDFSQYETFDDLPRDSYEKKILDDYLLYSNDLCYENIAQTP